MEEGIISGLISGITVAFLVVLMRSIWIAVVVPWFEERVYKDAKIEGKWFGLYPGSSDLRQDVIILKRHGHAITGKMTCTKGGDEEDEYTLTGSFRNMLLPLTYESTDKAKTDRGSITLICVRNGQKLTGQIAFYNTNNDDILSSSISWFRSKSDLDSAANKITKRKDDMRRIKEEMKALSKEEAEIENNDDTTDGGTEALESK